MGEGYYFVWSPCAGCGRVIGYNPHHVPSIRVKDVREPVCRSCHLRYSQCARAKQETGSGRSTPEESRIDVVC